MLKRLLWKRKRNINLSVGFFHPYCNAGGGGERVLWCAIRAVQKRYKDVHCVVYTGDKASGHEILKRVEKCFNIRLHKPVEFIQLKIRTLVEAKHYPYFTLLLQSVGSIILGLEAALYHVPDIYIDTMGYAFTYPIFKHLCSCRVAAYVHYPTISTDMLCSVSDKKVTVNNREFISKSRILSNLKIVYYKIFAMIYSFVGRSAEVIMVNSSWTAGHILELWLKPEFTTVIYPPCDVSLFQTLPSKSSINKENLRIISIAQFRPEKNHALQINAFKAFYGNLASKTHNTTLVLIGSCRDEEDNDRVKKLKKLCAEVEIERKVEFKINLSFDEVIEEMKKADIALHTMENEHFGIGIVECMSAGLITIAHNSGGPKMDIIDDAKTGFLASGIDGYTSALTKVWHLNEKELSEMKTAARHSVARFSTEVFEEAFLKATKSLFQM